MAAHCDAETWRKRPSSPAHAPKTPKQKAAEDLSRAHAPLSLIVIAGPVPATHERRCSVATCDGAAANFRRYRRVWVAGTSPAMTIYNYFKYLIECSA
jgi:hypothetical protein